MQVPLQQQDPQACRKCADHRQGNTMKGVQSMHTDCIKYTPFKRRKSEHTATTTNYCSSFEQSAELGCLCRHLLWRAHTSLRIHVERLSRPAPHSPTLLSSTLLTPLASRQPSAGGACPHRSVREAHASLACMLAVVCVKTMPTCSRPCHWRRLHRTRHRSS